MARLCQGQIVWAWAADPKGNNFKRRPIVILTRNHEVNATDDLFGVVASHTAWCRKPWPSCYVELPHDPNGDCPTMLRKPTVADCSWVIHFLKSGIEDVAGIVPSLLIEMILIKVEAERLGKRLQ